MAFRDDNRPNLQKNNKVNRLSTTFHRTFWLSRPQIRQILNLAASNESGPPSDCLTLELIRERTQLGTVQVEAMPRYARACGLLDSQQCLTKFGKKAQAKDPLLETTATKWLMHYFISAHHGFGPPFWSSIVGSRFKSGDEFKHADIAEDIGRIHAQSEGKQIKAEYSRSTATVFLRSYLEPDALGNLGILEMLEDDLYLVLEPDPPSVWVFGLALLDFWGAHYGYDRLTINLDDLSAEGGLGDIFLIGGGRINQYLRRLQEEGYVEVYRLSPPYQVVLRRHDAEPLLEKLYVLDDD